MRFRIRAVALPALAVGLLLSVGCGQTTNEEALKGESVAKPPEPGKPEFKSYGEAMKYQSQQQAKNQGKGAAKKAPEKTPEKAQ